MGRSRLIEIHSWAIGRMMIRVMIFLWLLMGMARAQSGLQQWDDRILEHLAATRTPGQTEVFRSLSIANNYVNIAVPAGLLVAGWIRNDEPMRQNALYIA